MPNNQPRSDADCETLVAKRDALEKTYRARAMKLEWAAHVITIKINRARRERHSNNRCLQSIYDTHQALLLAQTELAVDKVITGPCPCVNDEGSG